jgi:two-component system chemotaxis response regulator CheY
MSRIIVVDDDMSTGRLLKMLLEMEGYEVVTCATTAAAVSAADGGAEALIIDCYLANDENGLELLQDIRDGKTSLPSHVPVFMVSGDQRLKQRAETSGATAFLLKPYSPGDLTGYIREALGAESPSP